MAENDNKNKVEEELKDEELKEEEQKQSCDSETKEDEAEAADTGAEGSSEAEAEAEGTEKTDDAAQDAEAANERYLRLMAEFQNFKKRATKEKSDIHAYANEKIIGELLPVLDNFERALETKAVDDPEGYAKGMALIFEQMLKAMNNAGLAEIPALGENFDPSKHNAVMTEESEEYDSGKVSKVLQKGYTLNDRVIRPTMVSVSK